MRALFALLFCVGFAVNVARAQEQKLPPALQGALDRIAKGEVALPTSKPAVRGATSATPKTCSVPLVEAKVDHPERFTMLQAVPKKTATMPQPAAPAPPCETHTP